MPWFFFGSDVFACCYGARMSSEDSYGWVLMSGKTNKKTNKKKTQWMKKEKENQDEKQLFENTQRTTDSFGPPLLHLPSGGFAILLLLVLWWRHRPPSTHGAVRVLLLFLGRLQDLYKRKSITYKMSEACFKTSSFICNF